jgi:outer membrane receptor for ferrienterochelin and colicin
MTIILYCPQTRADNAAQRSRSACFALLVVSLLTFVVAFSPAAVEAQTATGTLSGTVHDANGKPLNDALVTASSPGATRTATTTMDGRFTLRNLPEDTYSIVVDAKGFERSETDGVLLQAGNTSALSIAMKAGLETIGGASVNSSATTINVSSASIASITGDTFIDQGQASVLNVLDQIPGVDAMRYQGGAPGANSNISIRGAMPYEVQVMLDGHPINSSAAGAYGFNSTFLNSLLIAGVDADKGPGSMPDSIANAIGGTLNFRTPFITATPTYNALAGVDSWGGGTLMFRFSDTFGKLGVLIGASQFNTPGYIAPTKVLLGYHTGTAIPGYAPPSTIGGDATMTEDFYSRSQIVKLAYNFSSTTSLTLDDYSTQTYSDESSTGSYSPFTVVPELCASPSSKTCFYTAPQYLPLVGSTVKVFSASDNENEYDEEPFLTADLNSSIGKGTLVVSSYAGAIVRTIDGNADGNAVSDCIDPSCSANYYQAPFGEIQRDTQRGAGVKYVYPFGNNDSVTVGYDYNLDVASMCEGDTSSYVGTGGSLYNCAPGAGLFYNVPVQTNTYSLRLDTAIAPKLRFQFGNYFSSATGVSPRYDPHAGFVYTPNANTAIRVSYGSSFVAPFAGYALPSANVFGSGSGATLVTTATNDRPETSSGFDVGTDVATQRDARLSLDVYSTDIFNRFATATSPLTGTYNGVPYFNVQQNFNQANSREEGIELSYLKAPAVGFGYSVDTQLNRDYAYAQTPITGVSLSPATIFATGNGVQIPEIPFSRETYALTYTFRDGPTLRLAGTSYGQWNAFGQPGFTVADGNVRIPLRAKGLALNVGVTNLFNQGGASDPYTINNYGYSYVATNGLPAYRQWYPYQPQTFFVQLSFGSHK